MSHHVTSRLITHLLSVKPIASWAKQQARKMMIDRAEKIGVPWRKEVAHWQTQNLEGALLQVKNADVQYPDYYLRSFHAYEEGNLGWEPATEVEVATYAVHSRIWSKTGEKDGDGRLRSSYHSILKEYLPRTPQRVLDLGCSSGLSTRALQETFPTAEVVGLDLSPYFLAIAHLTTPQTTWIHAPAEATGLPSGSFDLLSFFLVFHELPQEATKQILQEARRLLRPGGHLALMDMNPQSHVYAKMPPYILTLLKSTEPYLDQYFALDLVAVAQEVGFSTPHLVCNSPRHRTVIFPAP